MRLLATGGAGYVGSHVSAAFRASGHEVAVYDDLSSGHEWAIPPGTPFTRGDVRDTSRLEAALRSSRAEGVLHFAAKCLVGESVLKPDLYFDINVVGGASLLRAMERAGVKRLLFSSTASVYGNPQTSPIPEDHPLNPVNPYGESKRDFENLLAAAARAGAVRYASLRYFNAAGCAEDGSLGEDHDPETHLIPNALRALLPGGAPLTVFGRDWPTRDGTCVRDYLHVEDLADAHLRAWDRLCRDGEGGVFNLGTGTGSTVLEVLEAIRNEAGRKVPVSFGPRRDGDPAVLVASNVRARRILGWTPCRSLADIVRTAWNWGQTPIKNVERRR
ncbi:MAG: UDP-glucose 4-epimerase GalE [Planctomycetes bacterium]|nr:UDP-glucose 4-epimerase GalE [Planctomycetota bacterium]